MCFCGSLTRAATIVRSGDGDDAYRQPIRGDVAFSFKSLADVTLPPELLDQFDRASLLNEQRQQQQQPRQQQQQPRQQQQQQAVTTNRRGGNLVFENARVGLHGLVTPTPEINQGEQSMSADCRAIVPLAGLPIVERLVSGLRNELALTSPHAKP